VDSNIEIITQQKLNQYLLKLAEEYGIVRLKKVLNDENPLLYKKDIYVCLKNILRVLTEEEKLESLKKAKNVYGSPIFVSSKNGDKFLIKNFPDFEKAIFKMKKYSNVFRLNAYSVVNTYLTIIIGKITGFDIDGLLEKGKKHIEDFIEYSLKNNPLWNKEKLKREKPVLVIPVGAAGSGKSTFYRELPNVLNISCDNIRYLLFKEFGPCFSPWESTLSWWIVNQLADIYLSEGYSVFYNGVNTDLEYRSPLTMENPDPLYAGIPYNIKIVYFEPPVSLTEEELNELKSINLWKIDIANLDTSKLSLNVVKILELIRNNYKRTLERTKEILEGKRKQDPFDVLYQVPIGVVKLFVEQSFNRPKGENVIVVPRKEIPDEEERRKFYKTYAEKVFA